MRKKFAGRFVLISSQLRWYGLLSVVQTEAVPLTQQQGESLGTATSLFCSGTTNLAVNVTWKEETMFQWKFPVSLWGIYRACSKKKTSGLIHKLSD